MHNII